MKKLLKINVICIVISMLINIFPYTAGAENYLWKDINAIGMFNIDTDMVSFEDFNEENDYVEPYIQLLIKYVDSEGEKIDSGVSVTPFFDTLYIDSDIDMESYVNYLKLNNDNISYIQKDYKLILSATENKIRIATDKVDINNIGKNDEALLNSNNLHIDDIIVAIIDSGIDIEHEAIKDKIYINKSEVKNNSDSDNNGYIDDVSGWDFVNNKPLSYEHNQIVEYSHGTHVAGIIAGDSEEMQGVHADTKILPLKAFESGNAYTSDIIKAIEYAENMGASVVNCSFCSNDDNLALRETIENSNMLFVCAAGNQALNIDENPVYPASFDINNIVSVAATDSDNNIAYFSNYGDTIDIAANGCSIKSSVPENEYGNSSGTSAATAYITGVVAEIMSASTELSTDSIKKQLLDRTNSVALLNNEESNINSINVENQSYIISEESDVDDIAVLSEEDSFSITGVEPLSKFQQEGIIQL